MTELERALVDLAQTEGASEAIKLFAARALLSERRDLLIERRLTRLFWLLGLVALANMISAVTQIARIAECAR